MGEFDTPTKRAEGYFTAVSEIGNRAITTNKLEPRDLAYLLVKTADGLGEMAVGLRATYILLNEVKEELTRHRGTPPRPFTKAELKQMLE